MKDFGYAIQLNFVMRTQLKIFMKNLKYNYDIFYFPCGEI